MKQTNELLRDLREDKDLKQSEIAERIGTTQQQYSKYETGESELPLRAVSILADFYEVSADYLMGRIEWSNRVPGLDKKVSGEHTAGEVMNDILSLGAEGRAAVVEYIFLQKLKKDYQQKKEKDGSQT